MSRRQLLATAAVGPLASLTGIEGLARAEAKTFLLVHGAWHGGWCWKKLTPLLREGGHRVLTPTMTGLGERAHLLSADVDLDTHIKDIVAVLECDDLKRVVLVGHSYGGMVITGVAARLPERISRLVYIDAFLPEEGKSVGDYAPVPPTRDDGWRVPPPGPPSSWGVTNARDIAWMTSRIGDQPLKTFTQPVQLSAAKIPASHQDFIQCTKAPFFTEAADRAKRLGYRHHNLLYANHDAMITQPAALAKILLRLV